jgi:DNA-binding GntR family transcriptional regulator
MQGIKKGARKAMSGNGRGSKVEKNHERSLAEDAYRRLKEKILRNEFPPSEFISIGRLSDSLGDIGWTPVREAVQRLHDGQFLTLIPRKGIMIPEFDIKKIMDQLELRFVIEHYATVRAAGKISKELYEELKSLVKVMGDESKNDYVVITANFDFHRKIIETVNNQEITRTLSQIYDHNTRFFVYFIADYARLVNTRVGHAKLLDALYEGEAEKVGKLIDLHNAGTRQLLLDSILG